MPLQVFVEARLAHAETWLAAGDLERRLSYLQNFADPLPFRILDELGLSHHLAGTNGGGQFLLLVPDEFRPRVVELLSSAAQELLAATYSVRMVWGSTENLGGWVDIRRRLADEIADSLSRPPLRSAPLALEEAEAPGSAPPALMLVEVDRAQARLDKALDVEEYVELARGYHEFATATVPGTRTLASGGSRVVLSGSLHALLAAARTVEQRFRPVAERLSGLAGNEGKTITAAIEVSRAADDPASAMYARAARSIAAAAANGGNVLRVFERAVEWERLPEVGSAADRLVRLVQSGGASRQFLYELAGFYRGSGQPGRRSRGERLERPWRFHRRLAGLLGSADSAGDREYARLRSELLDTFTGRAAADARLRPDGRVALEWARQRTEEH